MSTQAPFNVSNRDRTIARTISLLSSDASPPDAPIPKHDVFGLIAYLNERASAGQDLNRATQAKITATTYLRDARLQSECAKATRRELAEHQRTTLIGKSAHSALDLAEIAQLYRNPLFETFRLIFTDDLGIITSQIGITCRMPASTATGIGSDHDTFIAAVCANAAGMGATRAFMLHNHPSGDPTPSKSDIESTVRLAPLIEEHVRFQGHVVIDTTAYCHITPEGKSLQHDLPSALTNAGASMPSWNQIRIGSADALMAYAKQLQLSASHVTLISTVGDSGEVTNIVDIPCDTTQGPERLVRMRLLRIMLANTADRLHAVSPDRQAIERLSHTINTGIVINPDGTHSVLSNGNIINRRPRLSPDSTTLLTSFHDPKPSYAPLFDPQAIEAMRSPPYKGREKLISMRIEDFLALAKHDVSPSKLATTKSLLRSATPFSTLPFLNIDSSGRVDGHEGRHRARALLDAGHQTMPVILRSANIRWSEQSDPDGIDYVRDWPLFIKAQLGASNEHFTIPFPVERKDANSAYTDLPDMIDVNGKPHPRHDSEGFPIAESDEQLRLFWSRFAGSAAVDEQGRPLALYHGTTEDFSSFDISKAKQGRFGKGFYFAENQTRAQSYGGDGHIVRAYLDIKQPNPRQEKPMDGYIIGSQPGDRIFLVYSNKQIISRNLKEDGASDILATPNSLVIDGIARPTTNSLGHPIHSTTDGIRNFWQWFRDSTLVDSDGRPLVFFHGSKTPKDVHHFTPGGTASSRLTGDAYGVAAYFSTCPHEASFYAQEEGAVLPAYIRGRILNVDEPLSPDVQDRLSMFANDVMLPQDKARFNQGRTSTIIDSKEEAQDFFESQMKNWKHFADGFERAKPEVTRSDGTTFTIEYTDFESPIRISHGSEAFTLFNAIGWDNLPAAGFDGMLMRRDGGQLWAVIHRPDGNIKSALGNKGTFYGHRQSLLEDGTRSEYPRHL